MRSNRYFYDPSRSAKQPRSLFSQRFQAAYYRLFDVLQGFFHAVALGVTSGKCWAAHDVAAIYVLHKNDFEIHYLQPTAQSFFSGLFYHGVYAFQSFFGLVDFDMRLQLCNQDCP